MVEQKENKWWIKYLPETDIQANNVAHKNLLLREKLLEIAEKNKQKKEFFANIVSTYKKEDKETLKEKIWEDKTKNNDQILKEMSKHYSFNDASMSVDVLEGALQFLNDKFSSIYNGYYGVVLPKNYDLGQHILSEILDNPKHKQCSFKVLKETYLNFGEQGDNLEAFLLTHKDCKEEDLIDFVKKEKNKENSHENRYEDDNILENETFENEAQSEDKPKLTFWENVFFDEHSSAKLKETILEENLIDSYTQYFYLEKEDCPVELKNIEAKGLLNASLEYEDDEEHSEYPQYLNMAEFKETLASSHMTPESLKYAADLLMNPRTGTEQGNYDFKEVPNVVNVILQNPSCNAETASYVLDKVYSHPFWEEELAQTKQFLQENNLDEHFENCIKQQETKFQYQRMLEKVLDDEAPESRIELLVKYAHKVVQSGDVAQINRFKDVLFSDGPNIVYELDKKAMAWWVNNGTKENLEALNSFSSFYGMTTEVAEYSNQDTTIPRAIFEGSIRPVSKYTRDGDENPYYEYKHSQAFLDDKCNFNLSDHPELPSDKPWTIYDLSKNSAYQEMKKANINFPEEELQRALWEGGYHPDNINNPDTSKQFNVSDLTHAYCDWRGIDLEDEWSRLSLQDYNKNAPKSVREECWRAIGKNKKLVKFISDALREKDIPEYTIAQIWRNVEENGSPCNDKNGQRNVWGVSLQIHHLNALKDGGENKFNNFTVVMDIKQAYFDDYKGYWKDGGNVEYNSHGPNHLFDQPLIFLYKEGNKVVQVQEERTDIPRVKVMRHPVSPTGEHVVCYMGPNAKDCCVGSIDGDVHGIEEYTIGKKQQKPAWQIEHLNQGRVE